MPSAREPTVEMDKKNNNNGPARVHAAIGAIATCEVMTALYGCDWMFENVTVTLRGRLLGDRVGEEAKISLALYSDSSSLLFRVLEMKELWFQQDGATCHTARATIDLLKDTLGDRLISRFGPVNWPPRSCDLTPLDYFLWGYVKSLVYADKPQTLDHLEDNIRRVIADIRPQMLEKVIENWMSRLYYIRASRGSHI
ncbi:putative transposable element [Trichonephila clavipes]|nr:putative transposable element [Trichonephila clavipes]